MKKIIMILTIFLILIAIPVTVYLVVQQQELRKKAAPATTLSVTPSTITKNVNDEFTVEVKVDPGENQILAAELHVTFDSTKLEALSITNGPMMTNVIAPGIIESGLASITVGAQNTASPVQGIGVIASVRLKAKDITTSPIQIKIGPNTFLTGPGEGTKNLLIGSTPASITIKSSGSNESTVTPTQNPTSAVTPSTTPSITSAPVHTPTPTTSQTGTITPTPSKTPTPTPTSSSSANQVSVSYPTNSTNVSTKRPTITGTAPANATVTVTIYSTPQTCVVVASSSGTWSCTPQSDLADGPHNVVVSVVHPTTGQTYTTTQSFVVVTSSTLTASNGVPVSGDPVATVALIITGMSLVGTGLYTATKK